MGPSITRLAWIAAFIALAGCGVTYNSPSVQEQTGDAAVRVIPLTGETVLLANRASYTPRSLPDVFYASAGGGSVPRGVGSGSRLPDAGGPPPEQARLRLPPPATRQPYRIGVGDVLRLTMKGDAILPAAASAPRGHTVRDDGSVSLPAIGTVQLGGLTLAEAEAELFRALVSNQIDPAFSLEVSEFNASQIAVGGAVATPTLVPVTLSLPNLGEALTASGGLSTANREFAVIRIYRDGTLYQIPLEEFLARPDLQALPLQAEDAIYVDETYDLDRAAAFYRQRIEIEAAGRAVRAQALAELQAEVGLRRAALDEQRQNFEARSAYDAEARDYVYLAGEVTEQGRIALPYGRQASLADVLYDGGGFRTETGDPAHIYVLRASNNPAEFGAVTAWHLDTRNAAMITLATRLQMRPNDVVFIKEQAITTWSRALSQLFPPLISATVN